MTYIEARKRYSELYRSSDPGNRMKAAGLLEILRSYEKDGLGEFSSAVALSRIAEGYAEEQLEFYRTFGREEYRQKAFAARECIVRYLTTDEITRSLKSCKSSPSLANYVTYMKEAGLIDRVRADDLRSAMEVAKLR